MRSRKKMINRGKLDSFIYSYNKGFAKMSGCATNQSKDNGDIPLGQEFDATIISKGTKGDGIAKYKSYTVIVPNTKVGDKVKVIVKRIIKKLIFAEKK